MGTTPSLTDAFLHPARDQKGPHTGDLNASKYTTGEFRYAKEFQPDPNNSAKEPIARTAITAE